MSFEDLAHRFNYHPPSSDDVVNNHRIIRTECHNLAMEFETTLPDGREKSLAITKLEEAMFWANAAIARNQE